MLQFIMRKLLALFLSLSILLISSIPLNAEAASCELPKHALAMQATGQHVQHDHAGIILNGHWQHDRIECGCGCHRSIDSLPHLLAPHSLDPLMLTIGETVERVSSIAVPATSPFPPAILSPPPKRI